MVGEVVDTLSPSPLPLPREIGDQLAADHKFEKWHRVHSGKKDTTRIVFIDLLHLFMLQQTSPHNLLSLKGPVRWGRLMKRKLINSC